MVFGGNVHRAKTIPTSDLTDNKYVCPNCNYHARINSVEYFDIIYDEGTVKKLFEDLEPRDF